MWVIRLECFPDRLLVGNKYLGGAIIELHLIFLSLS